MARRCRIWRRLASRADLPHTHYMECALFYPYVVPPTGWLKQSLLYYDVVGSVVDNRFMDDPPPDIAWLVEVGQYETVHADQLGRVAAGALIEEFVDVLVGLERSGRKWLPDVGSLESVNYGKLPDLVETQLVDLGVLRPSETGYLLQPHLLSPLICLLAKYASISFSVPGRQYSMHTTLAKAQDICLSPLETRPEVVRNVLAATLRSVLPIPDDRVGFDEILDFKAHYRPDLLRLRANAENFIASLLERGEDPGRVSTLLLEEIEVQRAELHRRMCRVGWKAGFATALVTAAGVTSAHLAQGATPWIFSGVGPFVFGMVITIIRDRPAPRFSYLHRTETTFT